MAPPATKTMLLDSVARDITLDGSGNRIEIRTRMFEADTRLQSCYAPVPVVHPLFRRDLQRLEEIEVRGVAGLEVDG